MTFRVGGAQSPFSKLIHGDLAWYPYTYFTYGEAIAEFGHLEIIFSSCPFLSFLRKKSVVWGKEKLKGSAQANLERNQKMLEREKWTGFDLATSTPHLAASIPPQELILQQDCAAERGVTTKRARIFGDHRVCGCGFFCRTFTPSCWRLCCARALSSVRRSYDVLSCYGIYQRMLAIFLSSCLSCSP